MTRFLVKPGYSVLLEVTLGLGYVVSICLMLPVIIRVIPVITHWVLIGLFNTPGSLGGQGTAVSGH